jgi:hypothetical protein
MKKFKLLTKPTKVEDLSLEDLYEKNLTDDWEEKAQRLRTRRWRKLKQQMV